MVKQFVCLIGNKSYMRAIKKKSHSSSLWLDSWGPCSFLYGSLCSLLTHPPSFIHLKIINKAPMVVIGICTRSKCKLLLAILSTYFHWKPKIGIFWPNHFRSMFGGPYGAARMLNWPHKHRTPLLGIATTGLRPDKGGNHFRSCFLKITFSNFVYGFPDSIKNIYLIFSAIYLKKYIWN